MCLSTFYAIYTICFPYTLTKDLDLIVILLLEYGKKHNARNNCEE